MTFKTTLPYETFEEWKRYGLEHGYERRNPISLLHSEEGSEKSWYNKGVWKKWLKDFDFSRKIIELSYQTFEEWKQYGTDQRYEGRNPHSLFKSKDKNERAWYAKGLQNKWVNQFEFKKTKEDSPWQTFEEWKKEGTAREYDQRNSVSLSGSDDKNERSWYSRGMYKKWLSKFKFNRRNDVPRWNEFDEWKQFGVDNGYEGRNSSSLQTSKDKDERAWYSKGLYKTWVSKFTFKRVNRKRMEFDEWYQEGIEQGFHKRNPVSLLKSQDKTERTWYKLGIKYRWSKDFPFVRKRTENNLNNSQDLENLLEVYVGGNT